MSETEAEPIVLDVRAIPKPQRHPLIFEALDALPVGQSAVVCNDHNPIPLRGQVEAIYGDQFGWKYLEEGPPIFRLQFTRQSPAPAGWQRSDAHSTHPLTASETSSNAAPPLWVDLLERSAVASHSGPQWGHESEDLDITLLSWESGRRIEPHINSEVDVIWIGVAGEGVVKINGEPHEMRPGVALLIPKGCERAVESTSQRLSYLSVHRRRRGLMPTIGGRPLS